MKRGALVVDLGRGSVVDEAAVAASLASGHLAGYAADVFEMGDWAALDTGPGSNHPGLLADRKRTFLTPHLARPWTIPAAPSHWKPRATFSMRSLGARRAARSTQRVRTRQPAAWRRSRRATSRPGCRSSPARVHRCPGLRRRR